MRSSLFAAVALGPLCAVAAFAPAHATDTINSSQSTPVATATATSGDPDDVDVASGGAVQPTTNAAPAVTLNSNNNLTNEGTIQLDNVNNSVAVRILGGNTGSFTSSGTLNNIEDFTAADNNQDGVVEAPLAQGTGRLGIQVTGTQPFVGSITNSGSLFIQGNNSAAISVEGPLTGNIYNSGTIGVTGDNSFGIHNIAPINGSIQITGAISTSGQASNAVSLNADVSGSLSIYSTISGNGYSTSSRSVSNTTLQTIQSTPSETEQTGTPLVIGGNIGGGVFIGAPPVTTASASTNDLDGDGIPDGSEGIGSVTAFGSAPAILIGGANRNVTLGEFGVAPNNFGLIVRGSVNAVGLYDGVSATGVQIGGTGGAANVTGGIRLVGTIDASTYAAAATGLLIAAGGNVPLLQNENGLGSVISYSSLTNPTTATSTAILVQVGGTLQTIVNFGSIAAQASSTYANATAINDQSGTLTSITNQGSISAVVYPDDAGATPPTGRAIALDLSHNTTGVTLTQQTNPTPIITSGAYDSNNNFVVASTTPAAPSIVGDVLLGNGNNTVNLNGGTMAGALSLGSGTDVFNITNNAAYSGALTYTGKNLTVNVPFGTLTNTSPVPIQASSLTVGAQGALSIAVDPANNRAGGFIVSGPATLAPGAKVGINLVSFLSTTAASYTLISSPQLSVGSSAATLLGNVPYIAVASLSVNNAIGALTVNVRQRTAAEIGMNQAEAAAQQAVYAALPNDSGVQSALYAQDTRAGFIGGFDQMLPDYSGGIFRLADAASRAVSRAASDSDGSWLQEVTVGARLSGGRGYTPFEAIGLGISGGSERASAIGAIGVTGSLFTGDVRIPKSPGDNQASESQLEAGLTWRVDLGQLRLDARAAGGYVAYDYRREVKIDDDSGHLLVDRTAIGKSTGWSAAGRFGGSYRAIAGNFYLQPEAHVDYFKLTEGAYNENGGGQAVDLSVAKRLSQETDATVSVRAGGSFGRDFTWRPELEFGYREILTGGPGATNAQFAYGGSSFTLNPAPIEKGGAFGRFGFAAGNDLYDVSIAAGAEIRSGYTEGDLKFRLRLLF